MKPARFDYHRPETIDDAIAMLREYDGDAKVLAGGQSLIPLLNLRLAVPTALIDLSQIDGLAELRVDDDGLRVGALVTQAEIEAAPITAEHCPLLVEAVSFVAHPQIRARGTIGGTIAHGDSAAEVPTVLLTLGGAVTVQGAEGSRTIEAADIFSGFLTTSLAEDEIIVEVRFPTRRPQTGYSFCEFARRHGDFAIGGAAAAITLKDDGTCRNAQIGLLGAGSIPLRATELEDAISGAAVEPEAVREAAKQCRDSFDPPSLAQSGTPHRRAVIAEMASRAILTAAQRATATAVEG